MRTRILLLAAPLSACTTPKEPAITQHIRSDFVNSLARYGEMPIYPMRSNVVPGDIIVYVPSPCHNSHYPDSLQSIPLGTLPVSDLIPLYKEQYDSYIRFGTVSSDTNAKPTDSAQHGAGGGQGAGHTTHQAHTTSLGLPTSSSPLRSASMSDAGAASNADAHKAGQEGNHASSQPKNKTDDANAKPDATAPKKLELMMSGETTDSKEKKAGVSYKTDNLTVVAYPGLSVTLTRDTGGGLFAAFGSLFGAGASADQQRKQIRSISIGSSTELRLPEWEVRQVLNTYLTTPAARKNLDIAAIQAEVFAIQSRLFAEEACPNPVSFEPTVMVNTTVSYTSDIDFELGDQSDTAAKLAVATLASQASAKPASAASPATALQEANGLIPTTPGGSAFVTVGTNGSLVLKQTFSTPLAFMIDQPIKIPFSEFATKLGQITAWTGAPAEPSRAKDATAFPKFQNPGALVEPYAASTAGTTEASKRQAELDLK